MVSCNLLEQRVDLFQEFRGGSSSASSDEHLPSNTLRKDLKRLHFYRSSMCGTNNPRRVYVAYLILCTLHI